MRSPQPTDFEEYELIRPLGEGSVGRVYVARDLLLDRLVAIKFLRSRPDPQSTERFFREARAIARLQHPNVVSVYRVGSLRSGPYLVSEYVRGEPLNAIELPLDPDRWLHIAIGLARGLAAAHRAGVLHRDIKPANAIVSDEGVVKLLDFGLAKQQLAQNMGESHLRRVAASTPPPEREGQRAGDPEATVTADPEAVGKAPASPNAWERTTLTADGQFVGTPLYMAPELWRLEPATRTSDIYSLGAVLYELCTGRAPFGGLTTPQLQVAVPHEDPAPVHDLAPDLPGALGEIIDRCLSRDASERPQTADALRDALEALASSGRVRRDVTGNPYRGLEAFHAEHRDLYFGRAAEVRAVIERVRTDHLAIVVGDSGVGKSSLVRAGVLPQIVDGELGDARTWSEITFVPGRQPIRELATRLAPALARSTAEVETDLREQPREIARALARDRERGFVIFVDQLEELLTMSEKSDVEALARALAQLARASSGVVVLATLRSDFLGRLAETPDLGDAMSAALFLLRAPQAESVREAVVQPALAHGVRFETEEMVDAIVRACLDSAGGLPLLQFTLARLWETRDTDRGVIPAAALEALDGVEGALAQHADRVLGALPSDEQALARSLLLKLVGEDGTRIRRTAAELGGQHVLEALVRGRLVIARGSPPSPPPEGEGQAGSQPTEYEIAHEALVRGWQRLRDWLTTDAISREVHARMQRAAAEWERLGRGREALWTGRQLDEALRLPADMVQGTEREFLDSSVWARRRRIFTRVGVVASLPAIVLAGVLGVTLKARVDRETALRAHVDTARSALTTAEQSRSDGERLRLEAFDRFDQSETPTGNASEAEDRWAASLESLHAADAALGEAAWETERALALDADRASTRALYAQVLSERASIAGLLHASGLRAELLQRLDTFDDSGERLAAFRADGTLTVHPSPPDTHATLWRYQRGDDGTLQPHQIADEGLSWSLTPGSYVVELAAKERSVVRAPVQVSPGADVELTIEMPPRSRAPKGFVYVPAGTTPYGSADHEEIRKQFLSAQPQHPRHVDAFWIDPHEVTFAQWIEFLDALPDADRTARTPHTSTTATGHASLRREAGGWELRFQPTAEMHVLGPGETLVYADRTTHREQRWLLLPVVGVSYEDALAYVRWLDQTRRVPGARLCSEAEWERAARGADGRRFTTGEVLPADRANFDRTYGRKTLAYGPDEVGTHPQSRSPLGVDDIAGNVWEIVVAGDGQTPVLRGGSWYQGDLAARIANRQVVEPTFRDAQVGLRVCATP